MAFVRLEGHLDQGDLERPDLEIEFANDRTLTVRQLVAVYELIEKRGGVEYPHEKNVWWDRTEIELTRMEFRVVQLLLQAAGYLSGEIRISLSEEEEIEARKIITGVEGWRRGMHVG